MTIALAAFALAVAAALWIETAVLRHVEGVPVTGWLAEHVYIPALRATAVMVFVVVAYPQLFGISDAPPLGTALSERGGFPFLLNLLIVAGLLLPVVPPLHRLPALVLPLQAMIGVGAVFWAVAGAVGAEDVSYFPGIARSVAIIGIALAAFVAARWVVFAMASRGRYRALAAADAIVFACQIPAVWLYAQVLGKQLIIAT